MWEIAERRNQTGKILSEKSLVLFANVKFVQERFAQIKMIILKRILYLRRSLRVNAHGVRMEDRKKQALQVEKIFELVQQLHVCRFEAKVDACYALARMAQLARDPELRQKALDAWKELVDASGFEQMRLDYEEFEGFLARWSKQFKFKTSPTRDEVNLFCLRKLNHFQ